MPHHRPRAGRVNILNVLLILVIAGVAGAVWTFGPYYLDYMNVKEVSASAALKWYAEESEEAAKERLRIGLTEKGVDYVDPKQCEFSRDRDRTIRVYCYYEAYVYYPFTDYYKILAFEVDNYVDTRGTLEQY